jgi:hypothetical protein
MRVLSVLLVLFSISQAKLYHFSLDSVSHEEAVDFETGSRFHLGWFSWDMVSPANRSKDGVVADYLLSSVGLAICGCDANSHVVFDSAYATTRTIAQLKSASMLSLHDTTVFKPLIKSPDSFFILDVPFPAYAMENTRFVIKDEKDNYSLVQIRVWVIRL